MAEKLNPELLKPFYLHLGRFLAKHQSCLVKGFTLEINTEFLYCPECQEVEEI